MSLCLILSSKASPYIGLRNVAGFSRKLFLSCSVNFQVSRPYLDIELHCLFVFPSSYFTKTYSKRDI